MMKMVLLWPLRWEPCINLLTVDYKWKRLLIICWKQGRKGFLNNKCKCQKIFYHTNNITTMLMYLTHKSHITTVTLFLMAGSSEVSNSLARVAMHCLAKSSFWRHNFPDKDKNSFVMIHWFYWRHKNKVCPYIPCRKPQLSKSCNLEQLEYKGLFQQPYLPSSSSKNWSVIFLNCDTHLIDGLRWNLPRVTNTWAFTGGDRFSFCRGSEEAKVINIKFERKWGV